MSAEENKALVRRYFEEVLSKRNPELIGEIFTSDFVYHYSPAPPNLPSGMEGFKTLVNDYLSGFSNLRFTIDNQTVEGDQVVTELTAHVSNIGAIRTAPSLSQTPAAPQTPPSSNIPSATSGVAEPTSFSGKSTDRFVNDKIAESWVEFDVPSAEQQLGFTPPTGEVKQ
jgi:predicted ester cyclase